MESGQTSVERLVRTLAFDHPRDGHVEVALLVSLVDATLGMASHGEGPSGGASSGVPLNTAAVALVDRIRGDIIGDLIRLGVPLKYRSLPGLVAHWASAWAEASPMPAEEAAWNEALSGWESEIRRTIATLERAPVQDGECPICGQSRFVRGDEEGWALLREWDHTDPHGSMRLSCLPCGEVLASGSRAVAAALRIDTAEAVAKYVAMS